jgi:hypothetical protein
MLGDPLPSKRATGVSILTEMASPGGKLDRAYFRSAVETLCSYVRFDRDMYCRDAVFNALRRLNAGSDTAKKLLDDNLHQDLLRQIAEYAAYEQLGLEAAEEQLVVAAPEAGSIVRTAFAKEKVELAKQLSFAETFRPSGNRTDLAWSVRLTARDLARPID